MVNRQPAVEDGVGGDSEETETRLAPEERAPEAQQFCAEERNDEAAASPGTA